MEESIGPARSGDSVGKANSGNLMPMKSSDSGGRGGVGIRMLGCYYNSDA